MPPASGASKAASRSGRQGRNPRSLVTGGAGFVGSNLAARLSAEGHEVIVLDNLSRPGVELNWSWLGEADPHWIRRVHGDVRDTELVGELVAGVDHVFHAAGQVAVTSSLEDPTHDFDVNARGTLNLLEAARAQRRPPTLLFTSTNKVYGALAGVEMRTRGDRYEPQDPGLRTHGVAEGWPLDFHSPYGCSKGTADQYVLDYARTFGLAATVFRMSCVYGQRQFGSEDQGWVAHFCVRALQGQPLNVYGDGRQVRDILHIDDLLDAMLHAQRQPERLAGQAFNVGGGAGNTVSILELLALLRRRLGSLPSVSFHPWRTGDQLYYVSDCRKLHRRVGWSPRITVEDGLERLLAWVASAPATHARHAVG